MQHFIKHIYVKKTTKKEATSMFPILWHKLHSFLVLLIFSKWSFSSKQYHFNLSEAGFRNVMHVQQIQLQLTWSVS